MKFAARTVSRRRNEGYVVALLRGGDKVEEWIPLRNVYSANQRSLIYAREAVTGKIMPYVLRDSTRRDISGCRTKITMFFFLDVVGNNKEAFEEFAEQFKNTLSFAVSAYDLTREPLIL